LGTDITIDDSVIIGALVDNIRLFSASNVTVKNCDIKNSAGNGINITSFSTRDVIYDNIINANVGTGVVIAGNNTLVELNKLTNNGTAFIDTGTGNIETNNTVLP